MRIHISMSSYNFYVCNFHHFFQPQRLRKVSALASLVDIQYSSKRSSIMSKCCAYKITIMSILSTPLSCCYSHPIHEVVEWLFQPSHSSNMHNIMPKLVTSFHNSFCLHRSLHQGKIVPHLVSLWSQPKTNSSTTPSLHFPPHGKSIQSYTTTHSLHRIQVCKESREIIVHLHVQPTLPLWLKLWSSPQLCLPWLSYPHLHLHIQIWSVPYAPRTTCLDFLFSITSSPGHVIVSTSLCLEMARPHS